MSWTFKPALKHFERERENWNAINRQGTNHILLDADFVGPSLRHFGDEGVVLAVQNGGGTPTMALLRRKAVGVWETFQPSQAPLGLIVSGRKDPDEQELLGLTRELPGYALQLSVLQQDPDHGGFTRSASTGLIESLEYIETARISLSGSFEEYWKARGTKLRNNVARRRRRMAEAGLTAEMNVIVSPGEVAEAVREYGKLESKGWKSNQGTAVSADNAQGKFYREVLEKLCERGEGRIYILKLNGRIAAMDLAAVRNEMIVILKTTYDEDLSEYSPAFLMREEELKQLYQDKQMRTVEFYGRVTEWQRRWSEEIRSMYHLTCYRHGWVKVLRRAAKRFA